MKPLVGQSPSTSAYLMASLESSVLLVCSFTWEWRLDVLLHRLRRESVVPGFKSWIGLDWAWLLLVAAVNPLLQKGSLLWPLATPHGKWWHICMKYLPVASEGQRACPETGQMYMAKWVLSGPSSLPRIHLTWQQASFLFADGHHQMPKFLSPVCFHVLIWKLEALFPSKF